MRENSSPSKPVSGLTYGSSIIIDGLACQNNGQNCAFYYMGNGKVQSAAGLILSLLEQLCADGADLPPSLTPFYARDPRHLNFGLDDALPGASTLQLMPPEHPILSKSTPEQKKIEESKMGESSTIEYQREEELALDHYPTLEVSCSALKDVSQKTKADKIIIIDGWDECNMDSKDDFQRLFDVLKTLRWKICITSRRPPTDADPTYCSSFYIQQTDNAEDVRAFTENETEYTLLQRYQGFREKLIQNIVELSQGM